MSAWSSRRPGVADLLTLGNALCGAAAILVVCGTEPLRVLNMTERYQVAAMLFLCGTLLDVLDGAAARRWGGTALGGPLDSLADAVTFGVAPVVAVVAYVSRGPSSQQLILAIGGLVYVAAALVRLADFMALRRDETAFVGLPTTSACIAAIYLGFLSPHPVVAAVALVAFAVLMVSPVPYVTGSEVYALCIVGWAVGVVGIVGVVDIRVAAIGSIFTIVVVVPLISHRRAGAAEGASA